MAELLKRKTMKEILGNVSLPFRSTSESQRSITIATTSVLDNKNAEVDISKDGHAKITPNRKIKRTWGKRVAKKAPSLSEIGKSSTSIDQKDLQTAHRKHFLSRQSTFTWGHSTKSLEQCKIKENLDSESESSSSEESNEKQTGKESPELVRRTATCEELEKDHLAAMGKSLHTLRKDLLTYHRLKEWSFI